jgi:hypothetical protein
LCGHPKRFYKPIRRFQIWRDLKNKLRAHVAPSSQYEREDYEEIRIRGGRRVFGYCRRLFGQCRAQD